MLKVIRLVVGEMAENCYLLFESKSKKTLILDPGDEADYIQRKIAELSLLPRLCVATHGHYDHVLATAEIKWAYHIPFYMNKKDEFLLKKVKNYATLSPRVDRDLFAHDDIGLGGLKIKVVATPGHTPGSMTLLWKKCAFVGDTFFAHGQVGRSDFPYSDKEKLLTSVSRLRGLSKGTIVYPGHGEEFVL